MSEISKPHDKFFRDFFSRPEVSRDFLRNYLPADIVALLDLSSLELAKDSFVDKELRDHFSDILCKVRLRDGRKAYVYALLEHKSYLDRLVAFQVLRYMVRIWERVVRKHEEDRSKAKGKRKRTRKAEPLYLPPIIPIVIYHGESEWNVSSDFTALFDMNPIFKSFVPDFSYLPIDISHHSDDEIKGEVILRVGLLIMKYVFREELPERLPDILALLDELLNKRSGIEYLETIVTYLVKGTERLTEEELGKAMKSALSPTGGDVMATLAEKWRKEGEMRGEIRGLLNGIETGLELKFGTKGLQILPEIRKIQDLNVLMAINKGLRRTNTLVDLCRIYR